MCFKNLFFLIFAATLTISAYAASINFDKEVTVLYAPTITITPDQDSSKFPHSLLVKLLITNEGYVEKVYFANGINPLVKKRIENEMRYARFSPYLKQGIAVKSIVPYVVNFYFLTEEEYGGH